MNVLKLSTSTECENDLQTPTTTLLCPRDMLFACFDHLLSSVLVDGNVLMGPRLVVRIQWGNAHLVSTLPSDCATLPLRPAQRNPSSELLSYLQNPFRSIACFIVVYHMTSARRHSPSFILRYLSLR